MYLALPTLRLQAPYNAFNRSRPKGQSLGDFSTDGTTFMTIIRAYRDATNFSNTSTREQEIEMKSINPLGRALTRVTNHAGNTLLQSGKFATKRGLMYVIKRLMSIPVHEKCLREG
jgi:hypothetical protein